MLGDVNLDGKINAKDASLALVEAAENADGKTVLTAEMRANAEVNSDGMITAKDATMILRYCAYLQEHEFIDMRKWIDMKL